ncbi:hypothetical protein B0J13DRAFT_575862 [Dactylonectria estremocensis]|uniref:BZIP domain-containing protein n=1 Tax=Dactylonectria estremocensis TaxID=1079267 RepID=A0A9P9I921_9HYPO|nr:hypothetical protein B0J13DRAFT_575862 [Dactylonectria estremocensis]
MKRARADSSPDDDELKLRRERGRMAQRAFRQRQIDAINELRASNHAMQSAIASLSRVAARIGSAELTDAVRNARQAAGLDDDEVPGRFEDDQAGTAADELPAPQPAGAASPQKSDMAGNAWPLALSPVEPPSSPQPGHFYTSVPYRPDEGLPSQHQDFAPNRGHLAYRSGRMSPRLSYGLWLEPQTVRLRSPPSDIVPYLGGNTTLSSVVFWSSLAWGFNILRAALSGNSGAAATAQMVFGEFAPMKPDREVLDGIHARLTFRKLGYIASDHPGHNPEGTMRMQSMIARTCEANRTPLDTFLQPAAVEDLLRSRLGDGYRVVELGLQGLGSSEDLSRVRRLVQVMISSSVCLGDGPRWKIDWTVNIFDSWLKDSTVS